MNMRAERLPAVGIVDNVDPDNAAQILALMSLHCDLKGVVVTGRAANDDRTADIENISAHDSEFRTILNATRMLNFMNKAKPGHDVPVFVGTPAPRTVVPHKLHIDELDFNDLRDGQLSAIQKRQIARLGLAGNIEDARHFFGNEVGEVSYIVGGPMTDVAKLLRSPTVEERVKDIFAQFGMFGFGEHQLMNFDGASRGRRQFNVACDPQAAHEVLTGFHREIRLYPTDVTRVDAIGFSSSRELRDFLPDSEGASALSALYDVGYELMFKPRNEMIYVHDVAPALGALSTTGAINSPYTERPIRIAHVPHQLAEKSRFGEIDIAPVIEDDQTNRYIAHSVSTVAYKEALELLLR